MQKWSMCLQRLFHTHTHTHTHTHARTRTRRETRSESSPSLFLFQDSNGAPSQARSSCPESGFRALHQNTLCTLGPLPPAQIPQISLKSLRAGTGPEHPVPHTWYRVGGPHTDARPSEKLFSPPLHLLTFMLHARSVPGATGPMGWARPPLTSRNQELADKQASRHTRVKCITAAHSYSALIMHHVLGQVLPPK